MAKLRTALKILGILVRNPRALTTLVSTEDGYQTHVQTTYGLPFGLPTIDLLDLLPDFEETVEPFAFLESGQLPISHALVKGLARKYESAHYLEIGTWRGESVANVAGIAKKCVTLSLPEEELRQRGLAEAIPVHGFFSRNLPNVTHVYHDSETFDFSSLGEKFDLILVDGDYQYRTIESDTRNAFSLLKNEQSVIVWHGYAPSTEQPRWSSLAGILDGCPPEKRRNLYHVSNTKSAIYIQGRFKTRFIKAPELPNKSFRIHLSANPIRPETAQQ